MQLSTERQEEIKQLIANETFRNLTDPIAIKLFCIDTLIMYYNKSLAREMKKIFACWCPFCEFFNDTQEYLENCVDECLNCPWNEQTTFIADEDHTICNAWREQEIGGRRWGNLAITAQPRLTMLWEWREVYKQQLQP